MNLIQSLTRREAEEFMLLSRRIAYLTAKYERTDQAYTAVMNLRDVGSFDDFICSSSDLI